MEFEVSSDWSRINDQDGNPVCILPWIKEGCPDYSGLILGIPKLIEVVRIIADEMRDPTSIEYLGEAHYVMEEWARILDDAIEKTTKIGW